MSVLEIVLTAVLGTAYILLIWETLYYGPLNDWCKSNASKKYYYSLLLPHRYKYIWRLFDIAMRIYVLSIWVVCVLMVLNLAEKFAGIYVYLWAPLIIVTMIIPNTKIGVRCATSTMLKLLNILAMDKTKNSCISQIQMRHRIGSWFYCNSLFENRIIWEQLGSCFDYYSEFGKEYSAFVVNVDTYNTTAPERCCVYCFERDSNDIAMVLYMSYKEIALAKYNASLKKR